MELQQNKSSIKFWIMMEKLLVRWFPVAAFTNMV